MGYHPETSKDEEFIGNTHKGESAIALLHQQGVRTARLGRQAYDIDGKKLPTDIYQPVIINISESNRYSDVMMSLTFGEGFRRNR